METFKKVLKNPMVWVAVVYLLFPADLLPDTLPVVGTLDDLVPVFLSLILQARSSKKNEQVSIEDIYILLYNDVVRF